jgi:hypothetical protein
MGGGDLDGDKFLILWDNRLVKYSDKIQSYPSQDYDVESSISRSNSMVVPNSDERRETDWIHSAAMLDSVMLGAIENAYYALAKEFGIVSEEINQLNQLFSNLIDNKPLAIKSFETLCKKAYNPQYVKKSLLGLSDNTSSTDALWEKMLHKQKVLLFKLKQHADTPGDYITFRLNMQKLCAPDGLDQKLATLQCHFSACIQRKMAMAGFGKFRELVAVDSTATTGHSFLTLDEPDFKTTTYPQFTSKMKKIVDAATAELSKPLEDLRAQQKQRRDVIQRQKALYGHLIFRHKRRDIESVDDEVESCRRVIADLRPKLDDAKCNLASYKKKLLQTKVRGPCS